MSKFTDFANVATRPSSGLFLVGYEGTDEKRIETPALLAGLAPLTENKSLALTPDALAGSAATNALDISQTWNTTGNPAAIKVNITNTASGANSLLLDLGFAGGNRFKVGLDVGIVANAGGFESNLIPSFGNWTASGEMRASGMRSIGPIRLGLSATEFISSAGSGVFKLGEDHATIGTTQTIKAHDVTTGAGADLNLSGGSGSAGSGRVKATTNFGIPALTYNECTANAQYTDLVIITDVSSPPSLHHEVTSGGGNIGILCLRSKENRWIAISEFDFEFVT